MPTKYVFGKARATRRRPPCGFWTKPTSRASVARARSRYCSHFFIGMPPRWRVVRTLRLKRRRSSVPGIYLIYHAEDEDAADGLVVWVKRARLRTGGPRNPF